jgi:hypothetical protein
MEYVEQEQFAGAMIDWDNPNWGKPGHNVHQCQNGSWWDETDERQD